MPVKETQPSWADMFTSLPHTLGTIAVAAVKFITPKNQAVDKISNTGGGRPPSTSVSEVILRHKLFKKFADYKDIYIYIYMLKLMRILHVLVV